MAGARLDQQDNPFGVLEFLHWDHPWNRNQYPDARTLERALLLMKEAGIGWVRIDFIWQDIEPEQGKIDYAKYDAIVDLCLKHDIQILGLLDYCADWASPCKLWNHLPDDYSAFVAYATGVVSRYKGKVRYWELWNEPDSPTYWANQDGLKGYTRLLREVYQAVKKVDPGCFVLNGGLATGLASVNRLYDNGAQGYFDIMNIHIFQTPLDAQALKRASAFVNLTYKVMARNGDGDKKIWVTEIGCPGVRPGIKAADWWLGGNPSEEVQARWVTQVYELLLADKRVGKVFWAFFRDTNEHWENGVDYFGLVRLDFSKKPAFDAYRAVTRRYRQAVK